MDKSILLDSYQLPSDYYDDLLAGIIQRTASVVGDHSCNTVSSVGSASTSTVLVTPSNDCNINL